MTPSQRAVVRALVIAGGIAVGIAALFSFRLADWPIYLAFVVLSTGLFLPGIEILPRIRLAIAEMAATIGFLYIGGLPIIVLRLISPLLARWLRRTLPPAWMDRLPPSSAYRELFFDALTTSGAARDGIIAEWATFSLGLAARWGAATALAGTGPPITDAAVIVAAELCGYAAWWVLSQLSIYPDRTLIPSSLADPEETAFSDMTLVVVLALTPFVFLIAYGYRLHGLAGAVGWSISTLGLHAMLKRMHERRLRLAEQNRRLEALNRELEHRERLSAIGKMSSVVSHQILQQLGVIGIYADLIRHAGDDDGGNALRDARDNAVAIETALRDVNRVLTDLLVFSRDLRLNLYAHPLAHLAGEVVEECRAEAEQRGVRLRADCPQNVEVTLDKLKIKQALANIVRNAIEASPAGSEVVLNARVEADAIALDVADQGPGVPEQDREAVFTPFFTTKENGSGLGLAIARAFVEAHGGRLWVEPAQPRGAVFKMRLPAG